MPVTKQYCVSSPDGETTYRTDDRGARIIDGEDKKSPVYASEECRTING